MTAAQLTSVNILHHKMSLPLSCEGFAFQPAKNQGKTNQACSQSQSSTLSCLSHYLNLT